MPRPRGKLTEITPNNLDATASATAPQPGEAKREVLLTRIIDAPRELVFEEWTNPKHMAVWWGPKYFTNPVCEMDVRPGGAILIHMQGPDGVVYPMKGTFHEIVKPERPTKTRGWCFLTLWASRCTPTPCGHTSCD